MICAKHEFSTEHNLGAEHLTLMEIRELVFISVEEKDETTKRSKKITIHVINFIIIRVYSILY